MSIDSDASHWSDLFPEELIPDILELVVVSWPALPSPGRLDHEIKISKEFIKKLRLEKNHSGDLPFKIWYELPEIDAPDNDEGRIDILFSYIGTPIESVYFAFECKRLRIPYPRPSRLATNNSDYVGEQGMMCFVTGKYSGSVTNGGMIGYVMDGQTKEAITSVGKLIKNKRFSLKLAEDTGLESSSVMGTSQNVRETRHILNKRKFTIHHIFLAV